MTIIDYLVLAFILISLIIVGFYLSRISSKNTEEFMVAGRNMPWWLIGLSDLAVGLNTSNMLQDSRKVRQDGLMGLMHMWGFAFKTCVSYVFFARLWRRARFTTQMEFYKARYTGWQANFARIYDTIIFGGFVTSIWAAVGLVGLKKVATTVMGLPPFLAVAGYNIPMDAIVVVGAILIALTYSAASGARGIYWTDVIEFLIAIIALYVLFIILYVNIGGPIGLRDSIDALGKGDRFKYLNFLQPIGIVYIGMFITNPLLDHGGFDPGMQRKLSLKNEREAIYTMIFSGVAGFVIRGLPFIAIGLIGMFYISDSFLMTNFDPLVMPNGSMIPDWERVLPVLIDQYLPIGLTGLMVAAFVCSFMSSFDSNIHLTGSVFINDLYRPYVVKNKSEDHYVIATKVVMTIASLVTIIIGIMADDILHLGYLAVTISLGAGWIKLLRIIWWRANGTADVVSQIASIIIFGVILSPLGNTLILGFLELIGNTAAQGAILNDTYQITRNIGAALLSTIAGLIAMLFTKPEPMDKLCSFYRRMRPFGFWGPVRAELGDTVKTPDSIGVQSALVLCAVAVIWGSFFCAMSALLAFWQSLIVSAILIAVGGYGVHRFTLILYPKGEAISEYDETQG